MPTKIATVSVLNSLDQLYLLPFENPDRGHFMMIYYRYIGVPIITAQVSRKKNCLVLPRNNGCGLRLSALCSEDQLLMFIMKCVLLVISLSNLVIKSNWHWRGRRLQHVARNRSVTIVRCIQVHITAVYVDQCRGGDDRNRVFCCVEISASNESSQNNTAVAVAVVDRESRRNR